MMIISAAIKTKSGKVYIGRRHHQILNGNPGINFINSIQGFVNHKGIFKDRTCAKYEAIKCKQIEDGKTISNTLISEDLW